MAGWGVDLMLAVGGWTADLPGAVRTVPSAPPAALPTAFIGLLFISLWRGRLRWLGLPLAAAVLIWPRPPAPDLWIGDAGTNAAWRVDRTAVVVRPGVRGFAVDLWSRRRGLEPAEPEKGVLTCAGRGCTPASPTAAPVALWWGRSPPTMEQLAAGCAMAEVVSSRAPLTGLPDACAGRLVLDGRDYARGGSVELWRSGGRWTARWAAEARGDRPWSSRSGNDLDVSDSDG
jgi:competence protein ComEC